MITLQHIKSEQTKLVEMIAAFEAQVAQHITMPEIEIKLQEGEHYAGMILGKDGAPNHHLILLPGEAEAVNWKDANEFAAKAGGELPTRREQSLLYANLKEQFPERWYWSGEQHASDSDYAWSQLFYDGYQSYISKRYECRARAVRRLIIQ